MLTSTAAAAAADCAQAGNEVAGAVAITVYTCCNAWV